MISIINLVVGLTLGVVAGIKLEQAERENNWMKFCISIVFSIACIVSLLNIK